MFVKHDLDRGCLPAIKHPIDTKDADPVTLLGFQHQEDGHLTKMLDAGIIQPLNSEWASAHVLVKNKMEM